MGGVVMGRGVVIQLPTVLSMWVGLWTVGGGSAAGHLPQSPGASQVPSAGAV